MKTTEIQCCDLMIHATKHAIIRTGPVRFGPDVLDPPLNNINYCPWCGAAMTGKAAGNLNRGLRVGDGDIRKALLKWKSYFQSQESDPESYGEDFTEAWWQMEEALGNPTPMGYTEPEGGKDVGGCDV
jgi:hypothetical protein